jgi:predicted PurR-regulated permease PerM
MRGLASAVIAAIIIGTLYLGREVFVPIALAVLLSFVLAPLVRLLQRWRMPRGLAVVAVVLLAFVGIFMLGGVIATQVTELAGDLPRYQFTMREKIKSLRGATATSGTLERAADVLHDLGKELNKPKESSAPSGAPLQTTIAPAPDAKPIPVEVRQPPPTALESIAALLSPLIHPLTTTGIIAIFVIFMLLQREDLRNRLIKLAGSHDLSKDDRRARRRRNPPEPVVSDAARRECFVRCRDRRRFVDHRSSQLHLVGHSRRHSALRALCRRYHRGRVSAGTFGGGRPWMVHAVVDGGALCRRRARSGPRH